MDCVSRSRVCDRSFDNEGSALEKLKIQVEQLSEHFTNLRSVVQAGGDDLVKLQEEQIATNKQVMHLFGRLEELTRSMESRLNSFQTGLGQLPPSDNKVHGSSFQLARSVQVLPDPACINEQRFEKVAKDLDHQRLLIEGLLARDQARVQAQTQSGHGVGGNQFEQVANDFDDHGSQINQLKMQIANVEQSMMVQIQNVEKTVKNKEASASVQEAGELPEVREGFSESWASELATRVKADVLRELSAELHAKPQRSEACIPPKVVDAPAVSEKNGEEEEEEASNFQPEYTFAESIWDLGIFAFHPRIGVCGSFAIGLLLVLIVCMQIAFCVVCQLNFTENEFDEDTQAGLKDFRRRFAHDYSFRDSASGRTLAELICTEEADAKIKMNALFYGNAQLETLDSIRTYLNTDTVLDEMFGGRTLCVLALMCWSLTVFKHFQRVWHCASALIGLPRSYSSSDISQEDEYLVVKSIRCDRLLVVFCISAIRFGSVVALLYSGGAWLAYTTDAKDLVLNAAALEFVLDLDGLLFEALAPMAGRQFLSQLQPLPEKHSILYRGIDSVSGLGLLAVPLVTLYFFLALVIPLTRDMAKAEGILCDGDRNFAFLRDEILMVWFGSERKDDASFNKIVSPKVLQAVEDMTEGKTPQFGNLARETPFANLQLKDIAVLYKATYPDKINPGCQDDVFQKGAFQEYVRIYVDFAFNAKSPPASCMEAELYCKVDDYSYMSDLYFWRVLCPQRCGCVQPNSTVPDHRPDFGCPSSCLVDSQYTINLMTLGYDSNCEDFRPDTLNKTQGWKMWSQHMQSIAIDVFKYPLAYQEMMEQGCKFFAAYPFSKEAALELCEGTSAVFLLRPLSPICPVTCGCASGKIANCAPQCTPSFANHTPSWDTQYIAGSR